MLISSDTSFHNQVGEPLTVCPSKEHNNLKKKKIFKTLGLLRVHLRNSNPQFKGLELKVFLLGSWVVCFFCISQS